MKVFVIAAVDAQWGISRAGKIPWSIPADMSFFKQTTDGAAVLMGRNTWMETGGLVNRLNIVVSSGVVNITGIDHGNRVCTVVKNISDGIAYARMNKQDRLYICGGTGIYDEMCAEYRDMVDGVYLNRIHRDYNCDNRLGANTVSWLLSLPIESTRTISAVDRSDSAVVKMEFLVMKPARDPLVDNIAPIRPPVDLPSNHNGPIGPPADLPVGSPGQILFPIKKSRRNNINMVGTYSLMCATDGSVPASTAVVLKDPMTGMNAVLPEGAAVDKIDIYRDGDVSVTGGCLIQLGLAGDTAKYIAGSEGLSTSLLNTGHVIHKNIAVDVGISAETELRLTLGAALTTGALIFEIKYSTYS